MTAEVSEFRRGWRSVAAAFFVGGCGVASLPFFTMGVFTKPLGEAFGWSRAETQGFLTFLTAGVLVGSPLAGWLMDRIGVRRVTMFAVLALAAGLAALGALTTSLTSFYVIAALTAFFGAGTTSVCYSRVVISWFERHRGFALGLAISGPGLAGILAPVYATWLVETQGWRAGYFGIAVLPVALALPAAYVWLRLRPAAATEALRPAEHAGLTFGQAIRSYRMWVIGLGFFLFCSGTGGLIPHMIPLLTDRGLSGGEAARIAGISGLAVLFGRVAGGWLLDRFWAPAVAAVVVGSPAVFCLALGLGFGLGGDGQSLVVATAVAIGLAAGAEFDIVAYMVSKYFGLKAYGLIYGALYGFFVCGTAVAPPLFGWLFDTRGNYDVALITAGAAFGLGALIVLTLGRYPNLPQSSADERGT